MKRDSSSRVINIDTSGTIAIKEKVNALKNKGEKVITFAIGEPDFETPKNIKIAGTEAIKNNYTKYTPVAGFEELRELISKMLLSDCNLKYDPSQIIVANGAKQVLFEAFFSLFNAGDKVLIPTPCWVTFPEQVKLSEAVPLYVKTKEENNFELTLEDIEEVFDEKVKGIVLNNPNNPTGSIINKKELIKIADFVVRKDIWIISDEIYYKLIYDNEKHISIASLSEEVKKRTILINGFSKTYAMTGWRVGFAAGPIEIIKAMKRLQGHLTSGVSGISQKAAIEALLGPQHSVKDMVEIYEKRRNYMVSALNNIESLSCTNPKGAFYTFPNVIGFYGKKYRNMKIMSEVDFANYLLDEVHVAVVPGSSFHYKDHIRLTFATSFENIKQGLDLIHRAAKKLQ